ncbi:MAG: hypothetical protein SFU91_07165 [Chloroherpetonaceae bacterium]|nr:hypothetical protein [Chloroherpetonaceae bacterium]
MNIKVTKPKTFQFENGTNEVEGEIFKPAEIKYKVSGAIELGILIDLVMPVQVSVIKTQQLFLQLNSRESVQKALQGKSAWADIFLVPFGTRERIGGLIMEQELIHLGYGMIVRVE